MWMESFPGLRGHPWSLLHLLLLKILGAMEGSLPRFGQGGFAEVVMAAVMSESGMQPDSRSSQHPQGHGSEAGRLSE